ncbi:Protein YeeZ [Pseudoalteromonas sp. CIP111854]|uniref:Protein YeeZ n=1 Tax=Pseudoalteromonas holothuriae TaxID=2963714 RepID=A0A9W4QUN4_9GAMM|nr:NADP-binding protein [Pseudoalteromonas sp. CIP111854]CAH9054037.1 Protein YeeZ [Pseudoalteromonas sp. CIP111854]
MNKLVVLGAGWLGKPLCLQAKQKGWLVEGTRTQDNCEQEYERIFRLENEQLISSISLNEAYWVCAIPPRARHESSNYLQLLDNALKLSQRFTCKGFLLCSSTGVYPKESGRYYESYDVQAVDARQSILQKAEQMVLNMNGKVLRLAGLVGPNREPGRFVSGKQLASSSQGAINMVHQQDVIEAIFCLLDAWQKAARIYNVCNPWHPTRASYYQQKCAQFDTQVPTYASEEHSQRIIDGSAIHQLGFSYQHDI